MNTNDYYKYAALATASYVRVGPDLTPTGSVNGATFAQRAREQDRLPIEQAQYFFDPANRYSATVWNVLDYYGADDPQYASDKSGFAATLFERNGEKVLALRGTEPDRDGAVDVVSADAQIGLFGLALTQVVAMANYIARLRAPLGVGVPQLKVVATLQQPDASVRYITARGELLEVGLDGTVSSVDTPVYLTFVDATSVTGLGKIADGERVALTGHSLGGHLAYMAGRLFPDAFDPNVIVFNAPGYNPTTENLLEFLDSFPLGVPLGRSIPPREIAKEIGDAAQQLAIEGNALTSEALDKINAGLGRSVAQGAPTVIPLRSEDLAPGDDRDLIASELTGADKYGMPTSLPTENNNHVIEPFEDALALQATIESMRGTEGFTDEQLVQVLNASANQNARSYEGFAEGLYRLFRKDELFLNEQGQREADKLPTSNEFSTANIGKGTIGARNAFHDAVLRIEKVIKEQTGLQLVSLADIPAGSLKDLATGDDANAIAYRYALRELNPFAVLGPGALYEPHNKSAELDLYDSATGRGVTDDWIDARTQFLSKLIAYNSADGDLSPAEIGAYFEDQASNVRIGSLVANVARYVFAKDASPDTVIGLAHDDWLFGGAGGDTISAGFGNDYIEGGAGRDQIDAGAGDDVVFGLDGSGGDTLKGGAGYDTIYADWGDRIAETVEALSSGVVYAGLEKVQLTGGSRREGESFYTSDDGRFKYWANSQGAIAVFPTAVSVGDAALRIEAPLATVPGEVDTDTESVRGRPDLGIPLREFKDPTRPPKKPSMPAQAKGLWDLARTWRPVSDPLALDLQGDGFQTVGDLGAGTILFDHDANGTRTGTGWLTGADAWVVLDRDGDFQITSGQELFGEDTVLPDGTIGANGFNAIKPLDTNQDRKVDAADAPLEGWQIRADVDGDGIVGQHETRAAAFGDLRLWRDENLNGVSEPFELEALADAGVISINLDQAPAGIPLPGGNTLVFSGTYTREGGDDNGTAGALNLTRETFYREFTGQPGYAPGVESLPAMYGSGRVRDLQEAAADSEALKTAVEQAAAATARGEQLLAAGSVLKSWADSSTMPSGRAQAAARPDHALLIYSFPGVTVVPVATAYAMATGGVPVDPATLPEDWFEAQQSQEYRDRLAQLETVERFVGQTFVDLAHATSIPMHSVFVPGEQGGTGTTYYINAISSGIGFQNWQFLSDAHALMQDAAYGGIAVQTRLLPYVNAAVAGTPFRDFSAVEELLAAKRATDPAGALSDLVELGLYLGNEFLSRGWTNLPLLIRQWATDYQQDPALAPTLASLRVKFRDAFQISGTNLGDVLVGSSFNPNDGTTAAFTLYGGWGNDILFGHPAYDEVLQGEQGDDILYGGPGAQRMMGGRGRDVFLFGRGSDLDQLQSNFWERMTSAGDRDVIQFLPGVSPDEVRVRRTGFSGTHGIGIVGTADILRDPSFTDEDYRAIDEIRFADGTTTWDIATIRLKQMEGTDGDDRDSADPVEGPLWGFDSDDLIDGKGGNDRLIGALGNDSLFGGTGNDELLAGYGDDLLFGGEGSDILEGYFGNDVLDGGPGDDQLMGGPGADVYVLAANNGFDRLFNGTAFTFAGIDPTLDVVRAEAGIDASSVRLQRRAQGLHIILDGMGSELWDAGDGGPVEPNPYYLNESGVSPRIGRIEFADGTVWDSAEIKARSLLGASEGNDELYGFENLGDTIHGLGGNDLIRGVRGDDSLYGDAGDDRLEGGGGNDRLEGGDNADYLQGDDGNDVLIGGDGNDQLYGDSYYVFPGDDYLDGGAGDDSLSGGGGADTLVGGSGNDSLYGEDGSDVLTGGAGDDAIVGGYQFATGTDVLEFSRNDGHDTVQYLHTIRFVDALTPAAVDAWRERDDLVFEVKETGAGIRAPYWSQLGLSRVEFSDGTVWDASYLGALPAIPTDGNDVLSGTEGDDTISALAGQDTVYGLGGNDRIDGGTGADLMYGGPGDDTYVVDNYYDEVFESPDRGRDAVLSSVSFALGEDVENLTLTGVAPVYAAGNSLDNVLVGNAAANLLDGELGADLMVGGAGNDQYVVDDEMDEVVELAGEGSDAVFASISYVLGNEVENLTLQEEAGDLAGSGNALDNTIVGNEGANELRGGRGNDYLMGEAGADTYIFAPGDGADTIYDDSSGGDQNVLRLESIFPDDVSVIGSDSLYVTLRIGDGGDEIALESTEGEGLAVAEIQFADGSVWTEQDVVDRLQLPPQGGVFIGTDQADYLLGGEGSDYIAGLAGDDVLFGLNGDDVLDGGIGNDRLEGGPGSDWYVFQPGGGADLVIDEATPGHFVASDMESLSALYSAGELNVVEFGAGIVPAGVSTRVEGDLLQLRVGSEGDMLAIAGFDLSDPLGAHAIKVFFFDETFEWLAYADLLARGYEIVGSNSAPELTRPLDDWQAQEDAAFNSAVPADTFADPDVGDTLIYTARLADGAELPAWLSFDADSQTFSGTPLQADVGALEIRITATDGAGLSVSDDLTLTVANTNDAPTVDNAIGDQPATEDAPFAFAVPEDSFADEDVGDALAWFATRTDGAQLPSWLRFDEATRLFTGTPANEDVGDVTVEVRVRDLAGAEASQRFGVSVINVNDAPTLATALSDQGATEDQPFSYAVPAGTFADVDAGDSLSYSATRADGAALPGWLRLDGTTFSGIPRNADVGTYEIRLTATDHGQAAVSDVFVLEVANVNDAPAVANALGEQSFEAGSQFTFTVPAGTFADEDAGDSLTLGASLFGGGALPAWLSFDPSTATFSGNTDKKQNGISQVLVTATDVAGASIADDFGLVIRAPAGSAVSGSRDDDIIFGGTGNETLTAKAGDDAIFAGAGDDLLKGGTGNDVLQGGDGDDTLHAGTGQNVLDGGAGNDLIFAGKESSLIIGGAGNDVIRTGKGNDVMLFNRGDGFDTVIADHQGDNTLSFGGGIGYDDLTLSRNGQDLVVGAGGDDRVLLKNWYSGKRSVLNLQIVSDASADFEGRHAVQTFDFLGLVSAYDNARRASPGLTSWHVTNALLEFHLWGADDAAFGGDLAYWYARNRSLAGISLAAVQQVIGASGFGSDAQSLRPFSGLQEGFVKLS